MNLEINSEYFPECNSSVGFCNEDTVSFPKEEIEIFKYNLEEFQASWSSPVALYFAIYVLFPDI